MCKSAHRNSSRHFLDFSFPIQHSCSVNLPWLSLYKLLILTLMACEESITKDLLTHLSRKDICAK